jgi:hypothetical protein
MLVLAVPMMAPAATIDLVQHGTTTLTSTSRTLSSGVDFTAVTASSTILIFSARVDSGGSPEEDQVRGQLNSGGTSITFQRMASGATVTIRWYLVEFSAGVTVRRGSNSLNNDLVDISIGANVTAANSFPLITVATPDSGMGNSDYFRGTLVDSGDVGTDPDILRMESDGSPGSGSMVDWQVVTMDNIAVTTGTTSISAGSSTSPSVSLSSTANSWLVYSYMVGNSGSDEPANHAVRGRYSSATAAVFDRYDSSGTDLISLRYYHVRFTDGTTVIAGTSPFVNGDPSNDVAVSIDKTRTFAVGGWLMKGGRGANTGSDNAGPAWFTVDLFSNTILRITRTATDDLADLPYFVVQLPPADATPPAGGSVNDGIAADVDYQTSTTTIRANWSGFTDPETGVAGYEWAIGTTSGGTNVQGFTSVGLTTSGVNSGLSLVSGTTYFVTVRATNGAGLTTNRTSDGVTLDTSGPTGGTVDDGIAADIDWQSSTTTIRANWSTFADTESGIAGYEWAIGTTSGGTNVQAFTSVGLATSATNSALVLTNGQIYYVTVRATNNAGLTLNRTSDGVTVDTSGPTAGTVRDGSGTDVDFQTSTTTIQANWLGFADLQSGITGYEWAIGTTPGGTTVQGFTSVGAATSATRNGLSLTNGQIYYVTVRATSGTGATVNASSDGVTVDTSGPTAGTVRDGAGADVDFQTSTTTIQANWLGFADPQSNITGYEWAIGTTSGGTQVQGFASVGLATSASNSGLSLNNGQIYFVTVRATNGAGQTVNATSDGVTVDSTAPAAGTVNDGAGADVDGQTSTTTIQANWSGFADSQSSIAGYEWAIGTTSGGTQVQGFTSVGLATSASNGSLSLVSGTTYFVTVRATNGVGLTVTATSDGVTVDSTPPVAGSVADGLGADVDWQSSLTTIRANWSGFSDPQSGISGYEWAIGTTPGGVQIQGFTSVGVATNATNSALSLTNAITYYVTVRATNGIGQTVNATADGVTVDNSGPSAGTVNDGAAADVDFQTSTTTIQANWSGFADPQSDITGYEWAIGTTSGGTQVQGFVSVGLATSASNGSLSLANGQIYFVTVRATAGTGATVNASSDGVTADSSAPTAGTVRDGAGADVDFQTSTTTIQANWPGFADPHSGIAGYEWAIGTTSGGTQIQAFTGVGTATSASNGSLSLANGQIYFVTVRATNGSGLNTTVTSDGVTVDNSGPIAGSVNDGAAADVDTQTSTTTIQANWSGFSDAQSGIALYEWAIGTTSGGTQVQGFTGVGTSTSASNGSLSLANGTTYFVTVRATNGSGLNTTATSDGVLVDGSAPVAGTVNDGAGADVDFQTSTTTIQANWSGFADAHSGIAGYEWAIGTTSGGTQVQVFTSVGVATSASNGSLSLSNGTTYFVTVRATNGVGLTTNVSTDGVVVDGTAPVAGTVNDGAAADVDGQTSTSTIQANWSGFADTQSGIALYEWAIGTTSGGTQVQGFTGVGTATSASNGSLSLANGTNYYVTVRATNGAGLTATATSDGVLVDGSAPVAGTVSDGSGSDIDFQASTSTIQANWSGFSDPHSGIASYQWAIGTTPGGVQIQGFTSVGLATSASNGSLSLTNAVTYYVTVRATNGSGLTVDVISDGVTVDTNGPVAGIVNDGAAADVDFQTSTTTIQTNWSGFSDGGSGITGYEWAIGTTPGATNIQGFTSVGLATSASNSSLSLVSGTTYYVTVRATNGVAQTVDGTSDGVTVDTSVPVAGTVLDGAAADVDWQSSTTTIQANWSGFADAQSGVAGYAWAIGTTSGGTQIQGFTSVGSATSASNSSLSLANGQIYFVTVRATNGAGLTINATSDGVTVDTSGPVAGTVRDGTAADIDLQASTTTIQANWLGFTDAQSGIAGYEWAVGTTPGGAQIQAFTGVGLATNASNASLGLANGVTYYITVRATNGAGLTVNATSDGVTVDSSPPLAGTVNDGAAADVDWQSSTSTIQANWGGFSDGGSGVAGYEWAIGTTSGGTQVQAFTSVALATSASNSALSLTNGTTYFVTVRATNGVGLTVTATSDGVTVDTSAPVAGTVNDGAGADVDVQTSTTTIQANWSGFSDAQSGVAGYEWAIGTSAGGTQIQGFTSVGMSSSASNGALPLANGTTYFVTIRATNVAGLTVTASSDGVLVDGSAPVAGTVNDGAAADVDVQTSTTTIQANWSGFSDAHSGIAGYEWAIGTTSGGTQIQAFASVGSATSASNGSLALTNGSTYFVTVRATNGSGLTVNATSDGVLVDGSGPVAGTVRDGSGADVDIQTSTTTIQANWLGFSDAHSGIAGYEWAIGTTPGGTQIQGFTSVGISSSASNGALSLANGTTYFVTVRATNGSGLTVTATSDGVLVDGSAPVAGTVSDGAATDVDYQTSTTTIQANWSGFSDAQSGISGYEWAIGTTSGGTQVQAFTSVALATSASNGSLSLVSGTTYFVTVRATNGSGLTVAASSDGVTVDASAPVAGTVNDGSGADVDTQTSFTTIEANWSGFADAESGITGYEWAIGSTPGGTQLQGFNGVGLSTSASNSGLTLTIGNTYYVTIRATNGAGLTTNATSDGVLVVGPPDHIVLSAVPATGEAGDTLQVAAQLVDAVGTPVDDVRALQLSVSGNGSILATSLTGASALPDQTVSGNSLADGSATVDVRDFVAETVTVSATGAGLPGVSPDLVLTFNAGAPQRVSVGPTGASVANACQEIEVGISVEDLYGNVVPGSFPVSLSTPGNATFSTAATTLVGAGGGGAILTGTTNANGTATALVSNASAQTDVVSAVGTGPALPAGATASLTWQVGPLSVNDSVFLLNEGAVPDPVKLTAGNGQIAIRIQPRDACQLGITTGSPPVVDVDSPLSVSAVSYDTVRNDGSWIATLTLPSCPPSFADLQVRAQIGPSALPPHEVEPICIDPALTLASLNVASTLACFTEDPSQSRVVTVVPRDQNGDPLAGAQVMVQQNPPELRATAAVEGPAGTFTVLVGSDRCGGVHPVVPLVNGVPVGPAMSASFACAPVDPARSSVTLAPSRLAADQAPTLSVTAVDSCGIPAFDRAAAVRIEPSVLATVQTGSFTDGAGLLVGGLTATGLGPGTAVATVDGVDLPPADFEFILPGDALTLSVTQSQTRVTFGSIVEFEVRLRSRMPVPVTAGELGIELHGLELVSDSASLEGAAVQGLGGRFGLSSLVIAGQSVEEPTKFRFSARVIVSPGKRAAVTARAYDGIGQPISPNANAYLQVEGDRGIRRGTGCGCGGGDAAQPALALLLLAWSLRRIRRRRD